MMITTCTAESVLIPPDVHCPVHLRSLTAPTCIPDCQHDDHRQPFRDPAQQQPFRSVYLTFSCRARAQTAGPGLRLAKHSHLPSGHTPSWRSGEALPTDSEADLCSVLTIDRRSGPQAQQAQHFTFLMSPRPTVVTKRHDDNHVYC